MNIANLKAFIETVQLSSISKAADSLHLTQPAVSLQIQNLENSIGYQLLTRSNRGVQLTEYGKVFYSYAQSFITLWDNLEHDLKTIAEDNITLQVGTCPSIGQFALPCALYLFKQKYPHIRASVQTLSSSEVIAEIRDHSLQIGFIEGVPKQPDIHHDGVFTSELILVASPDHDTNPIHLTALNNLPLILPPETSDVRRALKKQPVLPDTLKPFLELDALEGVKSAVISGHGYSILPYFTIKKELYSGELKKVDIRDVSLEITFSMVWRKDGDLPEFGKQFIDFIKTEGVKSFC